MSAWNSYWYGRIAAIRPYLLVKLVLVLLAFDTAALMLSGGNAYGTIDFNAAHFRWLDWLQPAPSAGLYVGCLVLTSLLAWVVVLGGTNRTLLTLVFLSYTYAWAMSQLDGYQHHYLLSSVLLCFIFFPRILAQDILPDASSEQQDTRRKGRLRRINEGMPPVTAAWAYPLLGAVMAIVYAYTMVAKLDGEWLSGRTLARYAEALSARPVAFWFTGIGISPDRFWQMSAIGTVIVELILVGAYLVAPRRDATQAKPIRWFMGAAWLLAVGLHGGVEAVALPIGWFSYYMIAMASVYFLPAAWLTRLAGAILWPAVTFERRMARWEQTASGARWVYLALAGATWIVLLLVGLRIDLPGAIPAYALLGGGVLAAAVLAVARHAASDVPRKALKTLAAGFITWAAIAASVMRFEFYLYLAYTQQDLGDPHSAYLNLLRADRYAPERDMRRAVLYAMLGRLDSMDGDYDRAIEHYRRALQIRPRDAPTQVALGQLLERRGSRVEAVEHFRQAVDIDTDFAEGYVYLGSALHALGQLREALLHFRRAHRLDPQWDVPPAKIAWLLATHPDPNFDERGQAVALARRAVELSGRRNPEALDALAAAYAAGGSFDEAIRIAREAVQTAQAAGHRQLAQRIAERLAQYEKHQPYRLPVR